MSQQKQSEYAMELKLAAVRRVRAEDSVSAAEQELGIRRKRLYVWKDRRTLGGNPMPLSRPASCARFSPRGWNRRGFLDRNGS